MPQRKADSVVAQVIPTEFERHADMDIIDRAVDDVPSDLRAFGQLDDGNHVGLGTRKPRVRRPPGDRERVQHRTARRCLPAEVE